MTNQPEALRLAHELERLESTGWGGDQADLTEYSQKQAQSAALELRRLHEVNQELLEAAQKVLSNKRGEGDWLILSTYCEDLEAAIAKAKEDKK